MAQLCGEDEFYDPVVEECALCRDVCELICLEPPSKTFCARNCPGQPGAREQGGEKGQGQ